MLKHLQLVTLALHIRGSAVKRQMVHLVINRDVDRVKQQNFRLGEGALQQLTGGVMLSTG